MPSLPAPDLPAEGSFRGSVLPAASAAHLLLVCSVAPNLWLPSLAWLEKKLLGDYFRATEQCKDRDQTWADHLWCSPSILCCLKGRDISAKSWIRSKFSHITMGNRKNMLQTCGEHTVVLCEGNGSGKPSELSISGIG